MGRAVSGFAGGFDRAKGLSWIRSGEEPLVRIRRVLAMVRLLVAGRRLVR
jgi:hypothetical protein